jgi:preprotein translocase subunit SecD
MRRAPTHVPLALALALTASACGTTTIVASQRDARIYVDGEYVGRGEAEIRKRGGPHSVSVEARTEDGRKGRVDIKRHFTTSTMLFGLVTYGVGLFTMWEYPDSVVVMVDGEAAAKKDGWGDSGDAWSQPPPGWTPTTPAPQPAPGAQPAPAPAPTAPAPAPATAPATGPTTPSARPMPAPTVTAPPPSPAPATQPSDPWKAPPTPH